MENFIQGLIVAFREGLEALLIVVILLKFLDKTNNKALKKNVWYGLYSGVGISLVFGAVLMVISSFIGGLDSTAKLWESTASLIAVILIVTFILWMINHGSKIKKHIEGKAALNLTKGGIFLIALFMVAREGVEIVLFQFAGKYSTLSILIGVALSIALVMLIYYSLVRIRIQTLFNITLAYLILQAGFLLGYSVHEGLSASKELGIIASDNPLFGKAFDLSSTVLNHKDGAIGIPLYIGGGWYSKPEWIQFLLQYSLTALLFGYWYFDRKSAGASGGAK
ncbi:FTR1 family protein [Candidatus Woesearchaeota archaeon]|nr:FTR1 family protein [Candidatus Woesearchaeota archaeon]